MLATFSFIAGMWVLCREALLSVGCVEVINGYFGISC
jgi:hypothetical protein